MVKKKKKQYFKSLNFKKWASCLKKWNSDVVLNICHERWGNYCLWSSSLIFVHLDRVKMISSVAQLWSDSLRLQHAWPPCPSPTPPVYSNSCPLSRWCHPTISSSVIPFSSCPQSFPASGSFPMSQLFTSGGRSIGVSASASVLPMNTQDWSPLGWTGWISLQSRDSQESSPTPQFKSIQLYSQSNSHIHTRPLEKP